MSPRKQKEIIFKHVELDEEVPPGTQELVDEMMAEWLFRLWLKEKSSGESAVQDESKKPSPQNQESAVEGKMPEVFGDNI